MNDLKPKIGCFLSLVLALGMSGCFFHHSHRNTNNDNDNGDNGGATTTTTSHSGSHNMPRNRASDLADMIRDPDRHMGQFVSTYGPVRTIDRKPNGATVFQITTPNYAYLFIVSFPGEIPNLEVGKDTYFLGTVAGVQAVGDVEGPGGRGHCNPNHRRARPEPLRLAEGDLCARTGRGDGGMAEWQPRFAPLPAHPRPSIRADGAGSASPGPSYYPSPAPPARRPAPRRPTIPHPAAPAPAAPPAPSWQGASAGPMDSVNLAKIVQRWNELPPEAKERILGIVSEYSR